MNFLYLMDESARYVGILGGLNPVDFSTYIKYLVLIFISFNSTIHSFTIG